MLDPLVLVLRRLGLARLAVRRWFRRTFVEGPWLGVAVAIVCLSSLCFGCAALQAALPGLLGTGEAVAVNLSEAERAKQDAANAKKAAAACEAGRKQTARDIAALRRDAARIEAYVAADLAAEHVDAGAPVADAGAEGGL